jgi:rRNA maturation RNase YbeY
MSTSILYFKEDVRFALRGADDLRSWIRKAAKAEGHRVAEINYIFCSDSYLRNMNRQYLQHDYNTDIITFDNSPGPNLIGGDIFISVDRVKANARTYGSTFTDELHRVMIHGILHLCGYRDKTEKEKAKMREREEYWLAKR